MNEVYKLAQQHVLRFPMTINWRLKKHCEIINKHLNPGEEVIYAFPAQRVDGFFSTCVVCLTNKRILIAQKYILWGYYLSSITPDMYNDMQLFTNLIFGKICIDTIKEEVTLYQLSKKALPEIETNITEYMMIAKQKYKQREPEKESKC